MIYIMAQYDQKRYVWHVDTIHAHIKILDANQQAQGVGNDLQKYNEIIKTLDNDDNQDSLFGQYQGVTTNTK